MNRAEATRRRGRNSREPGQLTDLERRTLVAMAAGLRVSETAAVLGVEHDTVADTLARARRVLRAKNTSHAVAIALRRGLIS